MRRPLPWMIPSLPAPTMDSLLFTSSGLAPAALNVIDETAVIVLPEHDSVPM